MAGIGENCYVLFRIVVMVDLSKKNNGVYVFYGLHYNSHCARTVEHNQSGRLKCLSHSLHNLSIFID